MNKKICIIVISILLCGVLIATGLYFYSSNKKSNDSKYSIGFSFNDGYNIKIDLGTEKDDKFKVDVTDDHIHVNGAGSIIKRVFNYFTGEEENNEKH